MATQTVTLNDGLTLGKGDAARTLNEATIREATAGDYLDAVAESEQVRITPDGYQLLVSDALLGANLLRRQIVSIDDHPGPLSLAELKRLSNHDLNALNHAVLQLEIGADASLGGQELARRGRGESAA